MLKQFFLALKNSTVTGTRAVGTTHQLHSSGKLVPIPGQCNNCGKCAQLCPSGALVFSGKNLVFSPGRCIGCVLCVQNCHQRALKFERTDSRFLVWPFPKEEKLV